MSAEVALYLLNHKRDRIGDMLIKAGAITTEQLQAAIDAQQREIQAITSNRAAPTFANTVEPLERAGGRLPAGLGVADDADFKPQFGLSLHQIMDVPDETSDRRPQAMENAKRGGHD